MPADAPETKPARPKIRDACRARMPLDGTDAQAMEHALTMTERERDEALAVLREVEWDGSDVIDKCPVCGWSRNERHSTTCRLDAALKGKP